LVHPDDYNFQKIEVIISRRKPQKKTFMEE
jgi:hypothetical protein